MSNTVISKIYQVLHKAVPFGQHLTNNEDTYQPLTTSVNNKQLLDEVELNTMIYQWQAINVI